MAGLAAHGATGAAWAGFPRDAAAQQRVATARLLASRAASVFWGGSYTAATGEVVEIQVSDAYPEDAALAQRWADYLASLVHGPELSRLTAYLAPLDEVTRICGEEALACYSAAAQTLVAPVEDTASPFSAQAIVAHEYGHHVAANRSSAPWSALDYGTKRWSSGENVCARSRTGELAPGAEDERYAANPGEGFAEAYRVLNQQRLAQPEIPWQIVSPTFHPDSAALRLIEQDVRNPWTGPVARRFGGALAGSAARVSGLATPLDGSARITLRVTRGAVTADALAGTRRVARVVASAGQSRARRFTVCGQRTLGVRLRAGQKAARYTLTVSRP